MDDFVCVYVLAKMTNLYTHGILKKLHIIPFYLKKKEIRGISAPIEKLSEEIHVYLCQMCV